MVSMPGHEGRSDEALLERIVARDSEALAALYDRRHREAFSLAYRIVNDVGLAEDVVQEAFLSVWRSAATFDARRGQVRSWLLAIVHHRSVNHIRRRPVVDDAVMLNEDLAIGEQLDVWRQVYERMRNEDIRAALRQLPDEQRVPVELAYFGGMSYSEIAERLDVPLGTIKSRIRLAFRKLQMFLDHYAAEHRA
jgi:RNA polymerase sigma-70 factor (ECF subfamily)